MNFELLKENLNIVLTIGSFFGFYIALRIAASKDAKIIKSELKDEIRGVKEEIRGVKEEIKEVKGELKTLNDRVIRLESDVSYILRPPVRVYTKTGTQENPEE